MITPNEHGVYPATESLTLPREQKGWRGCPIAEIEFCNTGEQWLWATAFQLMQGDCHGRSAPLTMHRAAPTRADALALAIADLRSAMERKDSRDANAILEWLTSLNPAQMEMF